ncbi:MAG: uridine kinase [Flavobacteriaceae bacterium]
MIIIGICGGTASGKSTFSQELIEYLNAKKIKSDYLMLDNYYRDLKHLSIEERELVNFDDPKSIDFELFYQHLKLLMKGEFVNTPTYSYKTHLRKNKTKNIGKNDVLIIDGLFILLKKKIRDFFDLTIFLNVDESIRLERRIKRDVFERNRTENQIRERFKQMIKPMHDKFIQPSKKYADIIIDNEINYQKIIKKIEYRYNEIIRKNKEF